MTGTVSHIPPLVRVAYAVLFAGAVAYTLSVLPGIRSQDAGYLPVLDLWVNNGVIAGSAALVLVRAWLVPAERAAWTALGTGLSVYLAGNLYYYAALVDLPAELMPYPSWADAGWLAAYPFLALALVLLLRAQLGGIRAGHWLDGLIGGSGAAALAGAVVLDPVLGLGGGDVLTVLTTVAYPLTDLLLVVVVVLALTLNGWRTSGTWWLLGGGLVLFTITDSVYLLQVTAGTYTDGGPLDAGWPLAVFLLGGAAWAGPPHTRPVASTATTAVVPTTLSLAGAGVLLAASLTDLPVVTSGFATAAVVLATIRLRATLAETRRLADARAEARRDELTGLANRRLFLERLTAELGSPDRLAVLLVDLDGFKQINDSLGHGVGDSLLRTLGQRLTDVVRDEHVVARLGGDEFAVLLPGAGTDEARRVGHRIRDRVSAPVDVAGHVISVDASVGIAGAPQHGSTWDALLRCADTAMYAAKRSRTGVRVYEEDRGQPADGLARLALLADVRQALAEHALELHYQPIYDLRDGRPIGVEALVRWPHPQRGLLVPGDFLSVLVEAGLGSQLTDEVLRLAVDQAARWRDAGLPTTVTVNLSAADLRDPRLPVRVAAACRRRALSPRLLAVEVTESEAGADTEPALRSLRDLRLAGHRVALDDFGTGYSSLSYLRQLPVDTVKLDRSFLRDLPRDPSAAAFVGATVALVRTPGLSTVAEGVEDAETLAILADLGCDAAQGRHLHPPVPPQAVEAALSEPASA